MNYEHLIYQSKPTCVTGHVIESPSHPNQYFRVGTTLTNDKRIFMQVIEGEDYGTAFYTNNTEGANIALKVLETTYEDDGTEAATLEARAMELLRQARTRREQEDKRVAKLDVEVAEYRKTELTSNPITAKNFVEWENLDDAGKQGWRDRYTAVVELFKKKFDVGENVPAESWEVVNFYDVTEGDRIRVKLYKDDEWNYRTVERAAPGGWYTDGRTFYSSIEYAAIERKVK